VRIGAAAGDTQVARGECAGECFRIGHDLMLEAAELLRLRQAKRDGQAGELVDVRAALEAGEDGAIDPLCQARVGCQDAPASWAAERLVGAEGDDVGVPQRGRERTGDDHPRHVGDVGQEVGPDPIGDLAELFPVGDARVSGVTSDD
jgi:hypothetical protein